jgi:hypothetical protein
MDKKSIHNDERIVVFIGCYISEKSTKAKIIYEWHSWKFNVVSLYLGSSDGYKSFYSVVIRQ